MSRMAERDIRQGMSDEISDQSSNPESGAITGSVPPGAEPSPTTRGRFATAVSSTYIYALLGVALLITALLADQDSSATIGTVIAGLGLLAIAAMAITGLGDPVTVAVLGFVAGVLLTIVAFSAFDNFRYPQLVQVVAGAATFIASFASLAAIRRPGRGGTEEPGAGVENV